MRLPRWSQVDTTPKPAESLDAVADQLLERIKGYTDRADPALEGAELRERTIMYWIKSLVRQGARGDAAPWA